MKVNIGAWKGYLELQDYSKNTVQAYLDSIRVYLRYFSELTFRNMTAFKGILLEKHSPQTANLRIIALNRYAKWSGHPEWKLKCIRVPKASFGDDCLTKEEYRSICDDLECRDRNVYLAVKLLATTGLRISEMKRLPESVFTDGYGDVVGKGNRVRRIYIPKAFRQELRKTGLWNPSCNREPFWNIPCSKVSRQLKRSGRSLGLSERKLHPHSLRHFFAYSFLERCQDISLLADLMGHTSIETTRLYLRRSSLEQKRLIDSVVVW